MEEGTGNVKEGQIKPRVKIQKTQDLKHPQKTSFLHDERKFDTLATED